MVAAGPAGAVDVAYVTVGRGTATPGHRATGAPALEVEVVTSEDHGRHFGRPTVPGPAVFGLVPAPGILVPTGPSLATDSRDGAVYVTYAAYRPGTMHADIMVARSRNSGRTWSAPLRVTNGPLTDKAVYCQPQVVVDDAGTVAVSYFALAHGRVDVFLARSATHGARRGVLHTPFGPPQQITSRSFDPALGLPGGKEGLWWIGDYQGLAAGPGMFHPLWSDTRTGHLEIFTAALPGE